MNQVEKRLLKGIVPQSMKATDTTADTKEKGTIGMGVLRVVHGIKSFLGKTYLTKKNGQAENKFALK